MTTWDELATAEAERRDRKDFDWHAICADELFRQGAEWQRGQILTDEAIERAARALNTAGWTCRAWKHEPGRYDDCRYCRGVCFVTARAVLTEAIGDQE